MFVNIDSSDQSRHWREAKKSNREEKEKFEILFSNLEKRKRTLKFLSPVSRREREICKKLLHFWEEKENGIFYSQVSRGEREILKKISNFEKRREIWNSLSQFREKKEKSAKRFSSFEKRKRNGYSFLKFLEEIAVCPILHTSSFLWKYGRKTRAFWAKVQAKFKFLRFWRLFV